MLFLPYESLGHPGVCDFFESATFQRRANDGRLGQLKTQMGDPKGRYSFRAGGVGSGQSRVWRMDENLRAAYDLRMALVRILIDGYNLLHAWQRFQASGETPSAGLRHLGPALATGQPRHFEAARDQLIRCLTHYQDAVGTPITIFFDGAGRRERARPEDSSHPVEVLFSGNGQTADQMIERAAHRFAAWGEVLAVTDDIAERDTVIALGGFASSCRQFIQQVNDTLGEQAGDIRHHNLRERNCYQRTR